MVALAGPYFIFATLLVISGLPKVTNPDTTAVALESIGLSKNAGLARALGLLEISIGLGALVVGGRLIAGAVAAIYAAFAVFILFALRTNRVKSCGCFGDEDTPPSRLHLAIDLAAAAVAMALVIRPIADIVSVMGETPWAGLPLAALVAVGAWLALMVLTVLPAVFAAVRT